MFASQSDGPVTPQQMRNYRMKMKACLCTGPSALDINLLWGATHLPLDEIHNVPKVDIVIVILNVGPQNNLNLSKRLQ